MKSISKNSVSPSWSKRGLGGVILGLTGGIATGKSTVASYFIKHGYTVICADGIVLELSRPGQPIYKAVVRHFGKTVLLPDKTLNRKKIAELVFSDKSKLKALEKIIHPAVRREIFRRVKIAKIAHSIVVLDIPLLFEKNWQEECDFTICVAASQKIQIERTRKFRGMTRSETLARMHAQMPLKEKIALSDFVVKNTGNLKKLYTQVDHIIRSLESTIKN